MPTSTKCTGLNVETCDSTGSWQFTQTCPTACNSGSCGACSSGSVQCNGLQAQSCNASGQWITTATCPYVCSGGSCIGVCTPLSMQCSGATAQTCDMTGQWQTTQTCPFACSSGTCIGSCVPTSKKCVGNVPQTCDSSGAWQSGTTCPYVCSNGACGGVCVPGSTQCSGSQIQTCDGTGQWGLASACPAVPGATSTCSGGACTFTCNSGYADCDSGGGCETQLGTSSACLACGDQCETIPGVGPSPCIATGCQFKILATEPWSYITDISLSATDVYWSTYAGGATGSNFIDQVPKAGGTSATAWTWTGGSAQSAQALLGDPTDIVWYGGGASSWGIYQGPTVGGGSAFLASALSLSPADMAMDATYIYWIVRSNSACTGTTPPCTCTNSSTVWRVKRSGGAASTFVTVPSHLSSIAVSSAGSVYASSYGPWTSANGTCGYWSGSVLSLASGFYSDLANITHWTGGGGGPPLGDYNVYLPQTVVAVGGSVAFSAGTGTAGWSPTHYLFKVSGSGPSSDAISQDSTSVPSTYTGRRLVSDGQSLFWTSGTTIWKLPLGGGNVTAFYTAPCAAASIGGIVADANALYWTQRPTVPASCSGLVAPASVMRGLTH